MRLSTRHSLIAGAGNLRDILNANYVEISRAPSYAAKDVVVKIFVRKPFHGVLRRAIKRSRNPAGDHSG